MRCPEHPRWTLMATPSCDILAVRQEYESEKASMGWIVVARESELLPFNPPRLICEVNEESDGA